MVQTAHISTPSDHEIIMKREFNAPRELVFNAYTNPDFIPHWWGPRSHTTTVDVMDVRPGGRWRYVLHDGEGNEFACRGEYLEIDPPHRMVSTFESEGMPGHIVTETMTLEERDGKTLLTTISRFTSIEDRDWMMTGVEADASDMMDRLADILAELQKGEPETLATAERELIVTRHIDAPREMVFSAFTDTSGIEQWWGPNGFTTTTSERDVRVGGTWRFVMHGPDGTDYDNRIVYTGIQHLERLEYDHFAGDETDPHFQATVTFNDSNGGTEVALRLLFPTAANRDEAAKFGAIEGGQQSLGRLAAHLATR